MSFGETFSGPPEEPIFDEPSDFDICECDHVWGDHDNYTGMCGKCPCLSFQYDEKKNAEAREEAEAEIVDREIKWQAEDSVSVGTT